MAHATNPAIEAEHVSLGTGVRIGDGSRIRARSVRLGDEVTIGHGVTIVCDALDIGPGTCVADGAQLISPQITVGARGRIGPDLIAELNEHFIVGRLCDIGRSVRIVGQGFRAGDHLWLTDSVLIGGGGARGPRAHITIGDRSAIMERCFINVSEPISIGSDTALSNGVTILTHSLWQPVLEGGTIQFAPVRIGDRCILYVNAVVAPGVSIGSDVTVGAGALVLQDVPDASTAVGNPARVMRSTPPVPRVLPAERQDEIVRDVLQAWTEYLSVKGVPATFDRASDTVTASIATEAEVVWYAARTAPATKPMQAPTITLSFGEPAGTAAACHFDVLARTMNGSASALAEDLRDFLRRRTIRIYTERPFQSLPPANLERLRNQLRAPR